MNFENLADNIKLTVIGENYKTDKQNTIPVEIIIKRNFLKMLLKHIRYGKNPDKIPNINNISLSPREEEILKCISLGMNNNEISKKLNVSIHTTKMHISNIFIKLSSQDRTEAVVKAIKYNLLEI